MLFKAHKNGKARWKDLTLVSHRGGKDFGPENTMESLAGALEFGVEMVETDVRMSVDGVPFIHHGPFLGLHLLSHMSISEIKDKAPQIPTLEEYLDLTGEMCPLNLDIKRCEPGILAEAINKASPEYTTLVSSFDASFLEAFGQTGADAETGLLAQYELGEDRMVEEACRCGATTLLPISFAVKSELVDAAHEAGLQVITWTVNRVSLMESLIDEGVDGIITDSYKEMKESLESCSLEAEKAETSIQDEGSFSSII